jgi:hypothetical protein
VVGDLECDARLRGKLSGSATRIETVRGIGYRIIAA